MRSKYIIAFAILGARFCFAFRRHITLVRAIVFGSVVAFELLQTLTPDRHGTLVDATGKIAGGAFGFSFAKIVMAIFQGQPGRAH